MVALTIAEHCPAHLFLDVQTMFLINETIYVLIICINTCFNHVTWVINKSYNYFCIFSFAARARLGI